MKQGSAHRSEEGRKVEPHGRAVNVKGVSQIGEVMDNKAVEPMFEHGRGAHAPKSGLTTHHCGSQGKH